MSRIDLKKNIAVTGAFRIIILVLSFCISWLSARYLGVEGKGRLSYLMTVGGFIWTVLGMGLNHSYPYLIRKNPEKRGDLFAWTLLQFFVETLVFLIAGLVFIEFWSKALSFDFSPLYMALFVGYLTFTKAFMQMQAFYIGVDKILQGSISQLINTASCLLLLSAGFFLLPSGDRLGYYLGFTVIGLAVGLAYLSFGHKEHISVSKIDYSFIIYSYGFGFRAFISMFLISLLLRADIVIVKRLLDYKQVGIYSIAAHVVDMLQIASNLVGSLLLAKLSDTAEETEKWLLMKKMLMVFFLFLVVGNLAFILLGKSVLGIFFGIDFVPSYAVYLWLIPASFGLSFGSLFNNYLNSKGFPVATIVIAGLALLLNIGLNYLLIPLWGVNGAAFATSVAYLLWFVIIVAYEQKVSSGKLLPHLIPKREDWRELYLSALELVAARSKR